MSTAKNFNSSNRIIAIAAFLSTLSLFIYSCYESNKANLLEEFVRISAISTVSSIISHYFISAMIPLFQKAGMGGKDINKKGTTMGERPIPEPLGLIPAAVYIVVLCICHGFANNGQNLHLYTAAMACVTFMTLLGFTDDVLDLKWRYKLFLPLIASMPLLTNYNGFTTVILPRVIAPTVGKIASLLGGGLQGGPYSRLVDLGFGYTIYMALLSIFCTNAINIYAGINGLEAGQALVIACFVVLHNILNLNTDIPKDDIDRLRANHMFSIEMMIPFIAVTYALLIHNWYPSRVFVGDTFCYFAGMTFAMASILGHYSTTLLLFFLPQILNFVYSLPQLFGIIPCPRHRLPRFNKETGKLEPVKEHLTLINLILMCTGPLHEQTLCELLLVIQAASCIFGLSTRALYLHYIS